MSDAEWDAAVEVLRQERRWGVLWSIVLEGQVLWSWQATQALVAAGWQPQDKRRAECWMEVVQAVQTVEDPTTVTWLHHQRAVLRGPQNWVAALTVSPDGQWLASGSWDKTIRLWELPGGKERTVLPGHQGWVGALVMSPDGQ